MPAAVVQPDLPMRLRLFRWTLRLLLPVMLLMLAGSQWAVQGDGPNHAGLVVQFGNGVVLSDCIAFNEPQISGIELLQRSRFNFVVDPSGGLGSAVCSISGEGQEQGCQFPLEDCFCQCQLSPAGRWLAILGCGGQFVVVKRWHGRWLGLGPGFHQCQLRGATAADHLCRGLRLGFSSGPTHSHRHTDSGAAHGYAHH